MTSLRARDLMTPDVVTVPPETPVLTIARMLADRGISAAPVVDAQGQVAGVVTEGDLIRRLAGEADRPAGWFASLFSNQERDAERYARTHGVTARDVMTADVVAVDPDTLASAVAHLMEERGIRRVLVTQEGRLKGIVSRADLLRAVLRPAAPAEALTDDRDILQAAIIALREQPWTDMMWIFPVVEGGVVSLHGFARSDATRQGLRVLMEEIPGVKGVKDEMQDMPLIVRAMR